MPSEREEENLLQREVERLDQVETAQPLITMPEIVSVDGIQVRPYELADIAEAWQRVEKDFNEHVALTRGAVDHYAHEQGGILERGAEQANRVMEDLKKSYHEDFLRVMEALQDPGIFQYYWDEVSEVRGEGSPVVDRTATSAKDLAELWNRDLAEFYEKVAYHERLAKVDSYDTPETLYAELDNDLKVLWTEEQFLKLRPQAYPGLF